MVATEYHMFLSDYLTDTSVYSIVSMMHDYILFYFIV